MGSDVRQFNTIIKVAILFANGASEKQLNDNPIRSNVVADSEPPGSTSYWRSCVLWIYLGPFGRNIGLRRHI